MNNKSNKSKKTLIVILICALVTIGITIGISCYNYFGYVNFKIDYLSDYFDVNDKNGLTVETKIERSLTWDSSFYTDDLKVTYRDPNTKVDYSSEKVTDGDALHANAYIENQILHLPNYFDVHLYQMVTKSTNDEGNEEYTLSYYFYFYNINYDTIPNFDPSYIRMTFVNGIGEESDEELQEVLDDFNKTGETGNQPEIYSYSIMSENESDVLASYSIYDNPVHNTAEDDESKYYYVYRNRCDASADDQTKFSKAKQLTFSIYYSNDDDENKVDLLNLVEGTFTADLTEKGEVYTAEEVYNKGGLNIGYNKNFYQDSYKAFVAPKLIIGAALAFGISGIITTLFALIWVFEPNREQNKKNIKNKK